MDRQGKPNLKRERPEITKEDIGTRISGKLHHELHEVHHACKKSKTFETQKLVKRLKQLRSKGDDESAVKDHESQLECIKTIDHNRLGNTAFRSKLLKDKQLKENQFVQDALTEEIGVNVLEPPAAGTPLAKVQSRLLSSKIIASQIATSLGTLKAILNPDAPPTKKARSEPSEPSEAIAESRKPKAPSQAKGNDDSSDGSSGESDEEGAGEDDAGWESGTVDEGESEEDEEDEEESISGSDEDEDDDDDDTSLRKPILKAQSPKKTAKANAKALAAAPVASFKESTFLPSLSVGYIPGSDDSDIDDDGAGVADVRKNRRGQRARRAIWEKKYGRNANHMKQEISQQIEKKARPQPIPQSRPYHSRPDHNQQRFGARGSEYRAPEPSKPDNSDKPLHPSWVAKRLMKEKQSDAIVPSQGKKIKF